ncbi:MAG TPA: extracellular solute-binding protein [Phototrophicaceae bacterium]|nr:extracellular solute-binding protein [Phototrophicaceae bacterium]
MRKLSLLLLVLMLALGAGSLLAQDATPEATPSPEPTMTPTPLPPVAFTAPTLEFPGESDNFAGVDPTGQTVTYWHQYTSATQLAIITGLVEAFNASNPYGITINAIAKGSYNDIRTAMNNAIVSGDLPNLVGGYPNDSLSFGLDGVVVDLEPYFSDAQWGFSADQLADMNEVVLSSWQSEEAGRLGLPNQLSGLIMFTNSAMMQELGYAANSPVTVDEFAAAACAAAQSELTGADGAEVQGFPIVTDASQYESLVAAFGGDIWADGQWDFTAEPAIQALQLYKDLYDQGCAYIPAERFGNTADWARGLNPFAFSSSAGIGPTLKTVSDAGNVVADWKVVGLPGGADGKPVLQLFAPGLISLSGTPEQQLATWIFMRYFATPEIQAQWSQQLSLFPLSKAAAGMLDASKMVPQFVEMVNQFANDEVQVYLSTQNLSYSAVRDIIATGLADVTANGMDVAEVAQRMTDEAAVVVEDSQG